MLHVLVNLWIYIVNIITSANTCINYHAKIFHVQNGSPQLFSVLVNKLKSYSTIDDIISKKI